MHSQVRFIMHPADERDFERQLVSDESIHLIAGPRWKTETPKTSRSLDDIDDSYCIIWSTSDVAKLTAEYNPSCDAWQCRSEYATIQFLRSEIHEPVITEGRIAVSSMPGRDFPGFKCQEPGEAIRSSAEVCSKELFEFDNPMA